jgi:hypothetical protein
VNFIKRSKDNYWHVSTTEQGVYLRIGPQGAAQVIPARYAREIGEALIDATQEAVDAGRED